MTLASGPLAVFSWPAVTLAPELLMVLNCPAIIRSKVRINGVFLKEGEHVGKIDTQTGEETFDNVEDERTFSAEEVEREITAPHSNRKIIEEVAKHAYAHEAATDRFPKILIFAVNDIPHASHADIPSAARVPASAEGMVTSQAVLPPASSADKITPPAAPSPASSAARTTPLVGRVPSCSAVQA